MALHDLGGHGPALLLTHATGFCGAVWRPFAQRLAGRYHAFAPDLRGHGESVTPERLDFHWDGFADDVLAVVDHLRGHGVEGPLLGVGHSKGGAALLLAEQRRPGTFSRLYCFEPVVFPPLPGGGAGEDTGAEGSGRGNHLAEGALRRRATFASFEEAFDNFATKPPLDVLRADVLEAYVHGGFRRQDDGTVTLRCRPQDESQVYRMGAGHDAFAHLAEIVAPVTIATGRKDPYGPAAVAPMLAERLTRGELEVFDDLGHFGPLEDPDRVADHVAAAFAR